MPQSAPKPSSASRLRALINAPSILVLPGHFLSVMKFFEDNFERPVLKPAPPAVQAKD